MSYDVAKGRDLWDQTTAKLTLDISVIHYKKINYIEMGKA